MQPTHLRPPPAQPPPPPPPRPPGCLPGLRSLRCTDLGVGLLYLALLLLLVRWFRRRPGGRADPDADPYPESYPDGDGPTDVLLGGEERDEVAGEVEYPAAERWLRDHFYKQVHPLHSLLLMKPGAAMSFCVTSGHVVAKLVYRLRRFLPRNSLKCIADLLLSLIFIVACAPNLLPDLCRLSRRVRGVRAIPAGSWWQLCWASPFFLPA